MKRDMRYPFISCGTGGKMGRFVSLRFDFSFKHLFQNEEVRKYFLSDVLGIPVEKIRSVRLVNTFLWRQYRRQKQGILDVLMELDDGSRVNVELQIKALSYWDKRSVFYLSKLFTENLLVGQDYRRLKRCVCISILGFNLDDSPSYHRVYRLRNETGEEFTDLLEIQVIELNKALSGRDRMDDWITLFNAETEEDLKMLEAKTKNPGILEAIKEVRLMGLGRVLKAVYDDHMKQIRDQNARDDYVRAEGKAEGKAEAILELLEELGPVPSEMREKICGITDLEDLKKLLKLAAKANSLEEFENNYEKQT